MLKWTGLITKLEHSHPEFQMPNVKAKYFKKICNTTTVQFQHFLSLSLTHFSALFLLSSDPRWWRGPGRRWCERRHGTVGPIATTPTQIDLADCSDTFSLFGWRQRHGFVTVVFIDCGCGFATVGLCFAFYGFGFCSRWWGLWVAAFGVDCVDGGLVL